MGIFGLWFLHRINQSLEQIRRNQLTPAEQAAEDAAQAKEEKASGMALLVLLSPFLLFLVIIYILSFLH